jgi:L-rhamnose mutarotase
MKRCGFKMQLKPGSVAEYKRRHDEIWPELVVALRNAGISDYSIFLDEETLTLFAVRRESDSAKPALLRDHPVVRRWWDSMAPLMVVRADNEPVSNELQEVFYLE